ncbi:hypothetical protein QLG10_03080 [Pseudomonas sp. V98_8]|uniref:hypothetical protein n=1 Tax=Pseudomonas sp. V98_8 TaxID=3044228 RepID=UPI00249DCC9F|nr:hypothetical protein [Pseudomonas sp. V98_8]MDI3391410.1 hypothetical protein [Pseudomonas sp. V98_8]
MAVAIEDTEGNTHIYDKAVKVVEQGDQYVVHGPDNTVQAVYPKDEVKKLVSDN